MANDTFVTDFVDGLDSEALLTWCEIMGVPHNVDDWRGVDETLDDDHPEKADDLRAALIKKFQHCQGIEKSGTAIDIIAG